MTFSEISIIFWPARHFERCHLTEKHANLLLLSETMQTQTEKNDEKILDDANRMTSTNLLLDSFGSVGSNIIIIQKNLKKLISKELPVEKPLCWVILGSPDQDWTMRARQGWMSCCSKTIQFETLRHHPFSMIE